MADKLGVAEESGSAMVVGVKKGQRLLLEHQKHGIDELEIFGQVIHLEQSASGPDSHPVRRLT